MCNIVQKIQLYSFAFGVGAKRTHMFLEELCDTVRGHADSSPNTRYNMQKVNLDSAG